MNAVLDRPLERPPRSAVAYRDALLPLIADARGRATTAQDLIVVVLRRAILEGLLPPDARLRQRDLASVFETSRIPVREALRILEVEGLLHSEPYRGYRITTLDADAIEEVYEMRAALEGLAVRIAVPLMTDADVRELRGISEEIDASADPNERLGQCERFYFRLYDLTGRPRLVATIRHLRQEVVRSYRSQVVQHSVEYHQAFFAAVLAGEADAAADLLATYYRKISALLRRQARTGTAAG